MKGSYDDYKRNIPTKIMLNELNYTNVELYLFYYTIVSSTFFHDLLKFWIVFKLLLIINKNASELQIYHGNTQIEVSFQGISYTP